VIFFVIQGLIWLGSALSILFWAFVAYRLLCFSENHIGWNVLYATILFGALSGLAGLKILASNERWAKALLAYAVLSGLGVMLLYCFNILIPYEIWLDRGMPLRPF